ncbi:hypothetical protein BDM02DRAFT_3128934 [Thelephora ganbajun]|uniref:Uncharacterized protein n=1 Tax=Thelephora ganbajun TaxID=370292 RepID=A0ACB6ZGD1_THEGA|nr:hypothetical protein BDM02DRAFT_3128934 [Thelephora ganbajun]
MSRDKDVDSKVTTAAPSGTPSADVVDVVADGGKDEENVEREEEEEEETRERGFSAGRRIHRGFVLGEDGGGEKGISGDAVLFLVVVPPAYQPHVRHRPITANAASGRVFNYDHFLRPL